MTDRGGKVQCPPGRRAGRRWRNRDPRAAPAGV